MQKVSSSLDSGSALSQCRGGWRYRAHSLHQSRDTCFCMPSVMSTCDLMQLTHMLVGFGAIGSPQRQHSLHKQALNSGNFVASQLGVLLGVVSSFRTSV